MFKNNDISMNRNSGYMIGLDIYNIFERIKRLLTWFTSQEIVLDFREA